jgi:hypothetical protein
VGALERSDRPGSCIKSNDGMEWNLEQRKDT